MEQFLDSESKVSFQLGMYSINLCDSRWLISPHIYTVHDWSKYREKIAVMYSTLFLLKRHLPRSYDFGSIEFMIIKFIGLHGFNIMVHIILSHDRANCSIMRPNKWHHFGSPLMTKVVFNRLFDTSINRSTLHTSLSTAGYKNMGNPWWRHKMETFSALLAICAGNSPVPGEFPAKRPVTQSFDAFFDRCLNKQLSKQSWG